MVAVVLAAAIAMAAETNCPEHFAGGEAPDLINPKLNIMAREICYSGYALKHSGVTRTPIYSAEYLTRERLLQAKGLKRQNSFHIDANIPESERAELYHYAKSGYDRGHMAPSADMFDAQSQYESFSLANMVPQNPHNNRGAWAQLEAEVRALAMKRGKLYVVTGSIFNEDNCPKIGNVVSVPIKLFKAVIDVHSEEMWAFISDNSPNGKTVQISIIELEGIAGLRFFQLNNDRRKPVAVDN